MAELQDMLRVIQLRTLLFLNNTEGIPLDQKCKKKKAKSSIEINANT